MAARKGAETTVDIAEAYVHCAQAVLRSRLWQSPALAEPAAEIAVGSSQMSKAAARCRT